MHTYFWVTIKYKYHDKNALYLLGSVEYALPNGLDILGGDMSVPLDKRPEKQSDTPYVRVKQITVPGVQGGGLIKSCIHCKKRENHQKLWHLVFL